MEELCGGKASQDWPAGKEGRRGGKTEGGREGGREGGGVSPAEEYEASLKAPCLSIRSTLFPPSLPPFLPLPVSRSG
jgi:hypothetical protein